MKISYDKDTDALYIILSEKIKVIESEEVRPGIVFDYGASKNVVAIEIMYASKNISIEEIKKVLIDVA
jgi:uncharacterized protein YuzE